MPGWFGCAFIDNSCERPAIQWDNTAVTTGPKNVADNFTIEFWMKTTQTTGTATRWLNGKGLVAAYSGNVGDFGTSMGSNKFIFGYGNASSSTILTIRSTSNVNTGNWVHVAAVRNKTAGNVQIYVNGVLEANQTTSNGTLGANTAPVMLGILGNTAGSNFNGSLDEVRIWNVARTQSEIQAGMYATYPAGTQNLIDYFKLDETTGTTVVNTANAANNGTFVNTPLWTDSTKNYASYLWSNGLTTPTISATTAGNYTVQTTNADGCVSTTPPVTVSLTTPATIGAVAANPVICSGSSTTLTASGGVSYTWSPSSGLSATTGDSVTATPSATTTYTVTGIDNNGCSGTQTVTVTVDNPQITISGTPSFCAGGSTTLTASGAVSYAWSPSSGLDTTTGNTVTANPSETTTYTVTGNSASGCPMAKTVTVSVNPLPTILLTPASAEICSGTGTSIHASGATTYIWSPADGLDTTSGADVNANPLSNTTYTVTGTDANGCSNTNTIAITVKDVPVITANTTSGTICSGGSATLTADGGDDYTWSPSIGLSATTGNSVTASPTVTTTYTVTGTHNGCSSTAEVTVNVTVVPVMVSATQTFINPGGSTVITATGGESYSWSPATGLSATTGDSVTASPTTTMTYTVTASDANGCTSFQTITIIVKGNSALNFDGFDDYISVPQQSETIANNFTVEAWVKPMNPTKWMHVFSTRGGGDVTFDIQIGEGNIIHGDIGNGGNWIRTDANANFNYTVGEWMHVTFVVNNFGYKIYANGCEIGNGDYGFEFPLLIDGGHFISIGNNASEDTYFDGSIDAVKVYNSALSQADIQADMSSSAPIYPENIVAFYTFDEGDANADNMAVTTLIDHRSPSVYSGTLNNFTLSGSSGNYVEGAGASNVACPSPFNLSTGQITGNSAVLQWENSGCLSVINDIYVGLAGSGVPTNASDTGVTSPFTKTNLTVGNYEFYVRSNCNASSSSAWVGHFAFTVYASADITAIAPPALIITPINQAFTLHGQVQETGLTDIIQNIDGETPGIECWIGISTDNTDPATWNESSWQLATWTVV
ncbi:LamG-like jellyroll fold domain-containing protein [Flavobacterium sp. 3HN19-14]|uniref:LamG domain-containing protein n=1 Tax=Flavobacterium sp. 3HN19-14 TaxID=3448133 RepID=UPI003EE3F333